jgi:RimJ/RimL family protein N-acetyltransferase
MPAFRLTTPRLTVRTLARSDITEFTRYRNLPEVARYQDWPLPYTRDLAHELVDGLEAQSGPTNGGWVQLALDHGGVLVGDLAVWLDDDTNVAMVGYTLAPGHQGNGFAAEGLAALVDWLFNRKRVHRIAATIDPRNLASARVLERCGFEYEGTARSAAFVRGEWTDDARFSLLRDDWTGWVERPTGPPDRVDLVEVTDTNVRDVGALSVTFSQREFVAPVFVSIAEALVPETPRGAPIPAWIRAIEADGELTGFVSVSGPYEGSPHPYLWRMLVDRRHQGRGIGRQALLEVFARCRADGATHLRVSWVPDLPGSPENFYRKIGFEPTGKVHDGEVEAILELGRPSA